MASNQTRAGEAAGSRDIGALRPRSEIAVQALGLAERDFPTLRSMLSKIGLRLGIRLELRHESADVLLLGTPYASRAGPDPRDTRGQGRPVLAIETVDGRLVENSATLHVIGRRKGDLLRQFMDLALVRQSSPYWRDSNWTSELGQLAPPALSVHEHFELVFEDSRALLEEVDEAHLEFVQALLTATSDPMRPRLCASYGPGANLALDFGTGLVTIDRQALHFLRVRGELPAPAPGAAPQADAVVRKLDETLWDIGLSAGRLSLLDQPENWRETALESMSAAQVDRYSRNPRHLDLARHLAHGPATPTELRRHARLSEDELRGFIQAGLFLGLLRWKRGPGD